MNSNEPKQTPSLFRQMVPGLVVSLVIFGVLAWMIDWKSMMTSFTRVSPVLIFQLIVLQTIAFIFRSNAWRIALDERPTRSQAFWTLAQGYLLNLLPLRLGEVGRSVIMGGLIQRSPVSVFSTVVLERLFDLMVTALFLVISLPLMGNAEQSPILYVVIIVCIVIGLAVLFILVRNRDAFFAFLEKRIQKESKFGKLVFGLMRSVFRGLDVLSSPKKFFTWLFWILGTWVFWFGTMFTVLRAFFPELPSWATFFVQGISAFGGAVPSAPAGIGTLEAATMFALTRFGIDADIALGFAFFNHFVSIFHSAAFGAIGFIRQGQDFKQIFSTLRETRLTGETEER